MDKQAIIFDFDGVIVSSIQTHKAAWGKAYKHIFKVSIPNYSMEQLTGNSSENIARFLATGAGYADRYNDLAKLKISILLTEMDPPPLFPDTKEAISYIHSKGFKTAIASNAPDKFVRNCVEYYNLDIENIIGYDKVEKPKPSPDLYFKAAEMCNMQSHDFNKIIVVEDSPTGISATINAGMIPVAMLTTHEKKELLDAGAKYFINSLSELNPKFLSRK